MKSKKQKEVKKPEEIKKVASPLEMFFNLGNWVTKGDPIRKANFDYYMMWIIFLAFMFVFVGNLIRFFVTYQIQYIGWAGFGGAVMYFQYWNLQSMYQMRKMQKKIRENPPKPDEEVEDMNKMLKSFK